MQATLGADDSKLILFFDYLYKKYGTHILDGLEDLADSGIDYEAFTNEEIAEATHEILLDYQTRLKNPTERQQLAQILGIADNKLEKLPKVAPEKCVEAMLELLDLNHITDYYKEYFGDALWQEALDEIENSGLVDPTSDSPVEEWHSLTTNLFDQARWEPEKYQQLVKSAQDQQRSNTFESSNELKRLLSLAGFKEVGKNQ